MREKLRLAAVVLSMALAMALATGCIPPKIMNTLVKVTPSKTILAPGESFTVDVRVEPGDGVNVAGAQFDLAFNAQAVRLDSVEEGNLLKQGGAQTYFLPGVIDNGAGTLKAVAQVIIGAGQSVNTPGSIAVLHCTALTAGQTSAFALPGVLVGNMAAEALPLESPAIDQATVALPSDLDLNGIVDLADLAMVAVVFGLTGSPAWRREDVKGDGQIDVLDLIVVGQNIV